MLSRSLRATLALVLLFFLVPWISVQALPASWAFIFGAWALAMFRLAFGKPTRRHRALWFNVGVALLTLAAAEIYLDFVAPEGPHYTMPTRPRYRQDDPDLGYAPIPGIKRDVTKVVGNELIYEVTYTIGEDGLRVAPPTTVETPEPLLFFGCSLTYGEGLEDDEAYPHVVGALARGRYQVVNLAFSGYGPHQMLAMLESGKAAAAVKGHPRHAFFMAIPGHAPRVVGHVGWDKHGPRYRLTGAGSVRRDGQFSDDRNPIHRRLAKWVGASNLYKRVFRASATPEDFRLMATIVSAARKRVASTWPGCRFHVLLFDWPHDRNQEATAAFEAQGLEVHAVSPALPGLADDSYMYALHSADRHPNARAARGIAKWIVAEFLEDD